MVLQILIAMMGLEVVPSLLIRYFFTDLVKCHRGTLVHFLVANG